MEVSEYGRLRAKERKDEKQKKAKELIHNCMTLQNRKTLSYVIRQQSWSRCVRSRLRKIFRFNLENIITLTIIPVHLTN